MLTAEGCNTQVLVQQCRDGVQTSAERCTKSMQLARTDIEQQLHYFADLFHRAVQ